MGRYGLEVENNDSANNIQMHKSGIIYVKLIFTMATWGGTFVVGRIIAQTLNPFTAGFGRFAIASVFL